jgi:hypothetical protein
MHVLRSAKVFRALQHKVFSRAGNRAEVTFLLLKITQSTQDCGLVTLLHSLCTLTAETALLFFRILFGSFEDYLDGANRFPWLTLYGANSAIACLVSFCFALQSFPAVLANMNSMQMRISCR